MCFKASAGCACTTLFFRIPFFCLRELALQVHETPSVDAFFLVFAKFLHSKYIIPSVDDAKANNELSNGLPSHRMEIVSVASLPTHRMDSTSCQSGVPIDPFDLDIERALVWMATIIRSARWFGIFEGRPASTSRWIHGANVRSNLDAGRHVSFLLPCCGPNRGGTCAAKAAAPGAAGGPP